MRPEAYLEMAHSEDRHWWFLGRRAIVASVISQLGLPAQAELLEIGAGTGGNLQMLSAFGRVRAVEMDTFARAIASRKHGGRFDIRSGSCPKDMPFAGERFDLICLLDVLEHIEADVETLVAVRDLLSPGGRMLLTVPAYCWLWSGHDDFLLHKRRYGKPELIRRLSGTGLRLVRISYFNTLLFPAAALVRLKKQDCGEVGAGGRGMPHKLINPILRYLFESERFLLQKFNLPFGLSLLAILSAR